MRYLFPLTAISGGGSTLLLHDVEGFRAFCRGRVIGERFAAMRRVWDWRIRDYVERDVTDCWIVRDDRGRVVLPTVFDEPVSVNWKKRCRNRRRDFDHRDGPVPGLNRRRWGTHDAPRKRHGGRGVAARIEAFHSGDPLLEV